MPEWREVAAYYVLLYMSCDMAVFRARAERPGQKGLKAYTYMPEWKELAACYVFLYMSFDMAMFRARAEQPGQKGVDARMHTCHNEWGSSIQCLLANVSQRICLFSVNVSRCTCLYFCVFARFWRVCIRFLYQCAILLSLIHVCVGVGLHACAAIAAQNSIFPRHFMALCPQVWPSLMIGRKFCWISMQVPCAAACTRTFYRYCKKASHHSSPWASSWLEESQPAGNRRFWLPLPDRYASTKTHAC